MKQQKRHQNTQRKLSNTHNKTHVQSPSPPPSWAALGFSAAHAPFKRILVVNSPERVGKFSLHEQDAGRHDIDQRLRFPGIPLALDHILDPIQRRRLLGRVAGGPRLHVLCGHAHRLQNGRRRRVDRRDYASGIAEREVRAKDIEFKEDGRNRIRKNQVAR